MIFSGDVGALLAGFTFAAAVLLFIHEAWSEAAVCLGALIILPFLADILLTLLRRALKKESLLVPHKEHLYQRAIASGMSHRQISVIYYAAFISCSVLAIILSHSSNAMVSAGLAASIIIMALLYYIGGQIWRQDAAS